MPAPLARDSSVLTVSTSVLATFTVTRPLPANCARSLPVENELVFASGAPPISDEPMPSSVSRTGPDFDIVLKPAPVAVPTATEYARVCTTDPADTRLSTPVDRTVYEAVDVVTVTSTAVSWPRPLSNLESGTASCRSLRRRAERAQHRDEA